MHGGLTGRRPQKRLVLEHLEDRLALASGSLHMTGLVALSPSTVVASYQVNGGDLTTDVSLDIVRDANPVTTTSPPTSSQLVGITTLTTSNLTVGTHEVTVNLNAPLGLNPSQPYVSAVPTTTSADNTATFRIWTVGVATHGYQSNGQLPAWLPQLGQELGTVGHYDASGYIDWALPSALPVAGVTQAVAQKVVQTVDQYVTTQLTSEGLQPNDMVDVHLIGHSRGGDVMSQAATLMAQPGVVPAQVSRGFLKLSLLDPHPAHNTSTAYTSESNGPIGRLVTRLYTTFQAGANDPSITVPANVNQTEVFYQRALVPNALLPEEKFLNNWGETPVSAAPGGGPVTYYNLTQVVPSHEGIHDFYTQAIVPTLATAAMIPVASSPAPQAPTNGGSAFRTLNQGYLYESTVLRATGISSRLGTHLLQGYNRLDQLLDHKASTAQLTQQVDHMSLFLSANSGRGIPAAVAQELQGTLDLTRFLIIGQTTPTPTKTPVS